MANNEINEMFSFITKDEEASIDRVKQVFTSIYKDAKPLPNSNSILTKSQFQAAFSKTMKNQKLDEELLYLFYHLDREKKGYLSAQDIMVMFDLVGRKITLNEVENSFKYAKVYKNKMSFEDFKQYFHNF